MVTQEDSLCKAGDGNTRLNSQLEAGVDYLTFSGSGISVDDLLGFARKLALIFCPAPTCNFVNEPKSLNYKIMSAQYTKYREALERDQRIHATKIDTSVVIAYGKPFPVSPVEYLPNRFESLLVPIDGGCDVEPCTSFVKRFVIKLSGKFWGALSLSEQLEVLDEVALLPNVKCSRIDVCLDDFSKEIIPYDKMCWMLERDIDMGMKNCSGFSKFQIIKNGKFGKKKHQSREGTLYLGSRESKNFYRCYWKPDRLRFEREVKQREANALFWDLISQFEHGIKSVSNYLGRTAIGSVKFIRRVKGDTSVVQKNLDRCKAFTWWQDFIDAVGEGIKLKLPKVERTLAKTKDWFDRQVAPTLVAMNKGMGVSSFDSWIKSSMRSASSRQTNYHRQISDLLELERISKNRTSKNTKKQVANKDIWVSSNRIKLLPVPDSIADKVLEYAKELDSKFLMTG